MVHLNFLSSLRNFFNFYLLRPVFKEYFRRGWKPSMGASNQGSRKVNIITSLTYIYIYVYSYDEVYYFI